MTRPVSAALVALLCLITAAVFWPGLSGGFLFDDYPNILTNSKIHADELDLETLKTAAGAYAGPIGRPLATISFAIDYAIGGKDPRGYKLTSLLVHLLNAVLVFWLLTRLLSLPGTGATAAQERFTWRKPAIFTISLLWAIHPIQVSAVLYVIQRMETLSLAFVLLALVAYLHGRVKQLDGQRGWPWLAVSAVLAGVGLLSKETAILFPGYTLALELTVLRFGARRTGTQRILRIAYGIGAVLAVAVFVVIVVPRFAMPEAYAMRDFTLSERLLTQCRVLPMYLGQVLLPLPGKLIFYYDNYPKSTGLLHPVTTAIGGAFLLALLASGWCLRRKMPLVALGIFWFFAAHALTSNVFALELVFEHRNYFALLGVLLASADLVRRIPLGESASIRRLTVGVLVAGIGMLGLLRSATWGDPLLLATDIVARNPGSPRASSDLGEQYMILANGDIASPLYSKAINEFERGSRLANASPLPEQGLILMSAKSGQPVLDIWWERIADKLRARPIGPQEAMMVLGLVEQRYKGVAMDDRRLADVYTVLAERMTMPPLQYAQLGDHALTYVHDESLADTMFVKAIEHCADDPAYAKQLIDVLIASGHVRQAKAALAKANEMNLIRAEEYPASFVSSAR